MYFNKRTHLLSYSIMISSLVRLGGALAEGVIRRILKSDVSLAPDMLDVALWRVQVAMSVVEIVCIALIFLYFSKKLLSFKDKIDADDQEELGRLQKEYLGEHLSSLSSHEIGHLLQMWAVILIGAEFIYCVTSAIYRKFIINLMLLAVSGGQYTSFVSVYNMTHGFKYLEMITAIVFGITMTGILLEDRRLKISALIITVIFLLSFGVFQMQTISFSGKDVGIVWVSVIFHLTETIGLFALSVYLSKHYRGL